LTIGSQAVRIAQTKESNIS